MWSVKLRTILLGLLIPFSIWLLSSCAGHAVPDEPVCIEFSLESGWCRWTISNKRQFVDETHPLKMSDGTSKTWWEIRPTMVRVPAESWAAIKKFIKNICKDSEMCRQNVASWDEAVSDIELWLEQNRRE